MTTQPTIRDLLNEAAETHHTVYRIVDGDDPDWASWYADWLLDLSELPDILAARPVRAHLVHALVQLDADYTGGRADRAVGGLVRRASVRRSSAGERYASSGSAAR